MTENFDAAENLVTASKETPIMLLYNQLTAVDEHHFSDIYTDMMKNRERTDDYGIVYDSSNYPLGKRFKPILDLII